VNSTTQDTKPRISILTPVYNGSEYLDTLITSVLQQDYANYEHIVIDDGSTDNGATVNILRRYPHLKWKSQKNLGAYSTFNELLKMASGDIISIICADDLYPATTVFSEVASHFVGRPDLDVLAGRTTRIAEKSGKPYLFDPDPPARVAGRIVRYTLGIHHCAFFVRRRLVEENGLYFNPSYKMCADWDWIIRVLATTDRVKYTERVFAYWRLHKRQRSRTTQMDQSEIRRLCAAHKTNYLLHRAAHLGTNWAGMVCAAYSMARQFGPAAALRTVMSKARRALALPITR
jgi:glycosyltransferase involved in cell wall biosynthesis